MEPAARQYRLRHLRPAPKRPHRAEPAACAHLGCDEAAGYVGGDGEVRCRRHALISVGGLSHPLPGRDTSPHHGDLAAAGGD